MLLLISDANILIDIEIGGLTAPMFSLNYQFAVPDILFYEELADRHGYMLDMGLSVKDLDEVLVDRVSKMAVKYPKHGRNDLFALVLAGHEKCPLLTGDRDLRYAAETKTIEVRGTLWLVNELVTTGKISIHVARDAYQRMRMQGRRLPWALAEAGLMTIEQKTENEK